MPKRLNASEKQAIINCLLLKLKVEKVKETRNMISVKADEFSLLNEGMHELFLIASCKKNFLTRMQTGKKIHKAYSYALVVDTSNDNYWKIYLVPSYWLIKFQLEMNHKYELSLQKGCDNVLFSKISHFHFANLTKT